MEALETTACALGERDARLLQLANHDALTGLINRRRFVEELEQCISSAGRTRNKGALLFIDLDQFKYVNDTCGHPAGDRLIVEVAEQLENSIGRRMLLPPTGAIDKTSSASGTRRQEFAEKPGNTGRLPTLLKTTTAFQLFHCHYSYRSSGDETTSHYSRPSSPADTRYREAKWRRP
ncbi:MAG: GGDEF domain-containing protein [Woeseiaceae bacterium]|nr:GGDEF domain-containing protein [Woeseiaceae bacterium]